MTESNIRKIAVTGGNGFIANTVIKELIAQNLDVLSLQRSKKNNLNIEIKKFKLEDQEYDIFNALCDVDVVIHAAALVHNSNLINDDFINLNYVATKNLFELCKKAKVKKFIFLSSVSVYGLNSSKNKIDLSYPTSPNSLYAESKLRCEKFLLNVNTNVRVSIIRLPLVYGSDAPGNFGMLQKIANTNLPLPFLNVENRRSMIDVQKVAEVISKIAINLEDNLGVNILSENKPFSTKEIITRLRFQKNKSPRLFPLPKFIMKILFFLIGKKKIYEQLYEDLEFISTIKI